MMPVTVPLNWPVMYDGTAHAGPITDSRKKKDAARQSIEVTAWEVKDESASPMPNKDRAPN